MKILMVSMSSIHFFRWAEQLKDTHHQVFWIDVYDSNLYVSRINFIEQSTGWRNRWNYPGRYWLKSKIPPLYNLISKANQRSLKQVLEEKIKEINPDVIHSFVLQSAVIPIATVMQKFSHIKWIYSAWGNDLFYRQNHTVDLMRIKEVLPKIDYMFADCSRDYFLARDLGFNGNYLGTYPTGGGYNFNIYDNYIEYFSKRNIILIKGYQGKLGRCNKVLEALVQIKPELKKYNIVIYGANKEVYEFAEKTGLLKWRNFEIKYNLSHNQVLKLMGSSKISIGNNISDGLPNTLLEGLIMQSFPIQSNPGGATSELIAHGHNGLLIHNTEDSQEIALQILKAINNPNFIEKAIEHNTSRIKPFLEKNYIKEQVLQQYKYIESQLPN